MIYNFESLFQFNILVDKIILRRRKKRNLENLGSSVNNRGFREKSLQSEINSGSSMDGHRFI